MEASTPKQVRNLSRVWFQKRKHVYFTCLQEFDTIIKQNDYSTSVKCAENYSVLPDIKQTATTVSVAVSKGQFCADDAVGEDTLVGDLSLAKGNQSSPENQFEKKVSDTCYDFYFLTDPDSRNQ